MNLYKLRPLVNCDDLERVVDIIQTGLFWCARFSELNDPMEGVFLASQGEYVRQIYDEKLKYKICSFTMRRAIYKPPIWGYYAGGFKGVAIKIKVDDTEVKKIDYVREVPLIENPSCDVAEVILTKKLVSWKQEAEYRFLKKSDLNKHKIGTIKALYLGYPYGNTDNRKDIYDSNPHLRRYQCYKNEILKIAKLRDIDCYSAKINGIKVSFAKLS